MPPPRPPEPAPRGRILVCADAARRRAAACAFLRGLPRGQPAVVVAPEQDVAAELVRAALEPGGTVFGWQALGRTGLLARLCAAPLAASGRMPVEGLGFEALALRAAHDALPGGDASVLRRAGCGPGFARALAASLRELRLHGVEPHQLAAVGDAAAELGAVLERFAELLAETRGIDLAELLDLAREAAAGAEPGSHPVAGHPLLLLDLPAGSRREAELAACLLAQSPRWLITLPAGDEASLAWLCAATGREPEEDSPGEGPGDLTRLKARLFREPPQADGTEPADGSVRYFSAPGHERECVEIARILALEAERGVPFDEMAVAVRDPGRYTALLETALRRAGIPACFARGTFRPDPTGRAFLTLLECAREGVSVERFAEYLSFGAHRPESTATPAPGARHPPVWTGLAATDPEVAEGGDRPVPPPLTEHWDAVLRCAPRGRGPAVWSRLLESRPDPGGGDPPLPEAAESFRAFAAPLVRCLLELPRAALWGDWNRLLAGIALRALQRPERVFEVLDETRCLEPAGPVDLEEVLALLRPRLLELEEPPPPHRYGRVFVCVPESLRGRCFRVVCVPGLAERLFPRRPREDPLFPDAVRRRLGVRDGTREDLAVRERLLLRLAVGAATERVHASYPRLDLAQGRSVVPSFYAFDLLRAARGTAPSAGSIEQEAARASGARLAWPAPPDPDEAIDELEHDLAVLGAVLHERDDERVRGRAQYLLELHPCLGRSLRSRWQRWEQRAWSPADGLIGLRSPAARAALEAASPRARAYAVRALERFAACPYRFFLEAVHGLCPPEGDLPPEQAEARLRGELAHRALARAFRRRRDEPGSDPLRAVDEVLDEAERAGRHGAPLVGALHGDRFRELRADLRAWLAGRLRAESEWNPLFVELAFGIRPEAETHDAGSVAGAVQAAPHFLVRGVVDLVEQHGRSGALRITDHKTGARSTSPGAVVAGGELLQPLLYALAVAHLTRRPVRTARLEFCTSAGGFHVHEIRADTAAESAVRKVLAAVAQAFEEGFFPAAPRPGACGSCGFRDLCGPHEELRTARKHRAGLATLREIRRLR